jgi:hypothetical protein
VLSSSSEGSPAASSAIDPPRGSWPVGPGGPWFLCGYVLGQCGPGESGCWAEKKNIFPFSKNKISAVSSLLHRKISRADKFMKLFV